METGRVRGDRTCAVRARAMAATARLVLVGLCCDVGAAVRQRWRENLRVCGGGGSLHMHKLTQLLPDTHAVAIVTDEGVRRGGEHSADKNTEFVRRCRTCLGHLALVVPHTTTIWTHHSPPPPHPPLNPADPHHWGPGEHGTFTIVLVNSRFHKTVLLLKYRFICKNVIRN